MASVSHQFHATLGELTNLVEHALQEQTIYATFVEYFPYRAFQLDREKVAGVMGQPATRRLVFTTTPPVTEVSGNVELLDANPGALVLDIGRLGPRGLEESWLASSDAGPHWRAIVRSLKRITKAGVVGLNEHTGASAHYRSRRYTAGAKALAEQGVPMRQFAQSLVRFRFEE
jgi:hypothetical protein